MNNELQNAFDKVAESTLALKKIIDELKPKYKKGWYSNQLQNLIILDPQIGEGNIGFFNGSFSTEGHLYLSDSDRIDIKADETLLLGLLTRHAIKEIGIIKGSNFICALDDEEFTSFGKFRLNNGSLVDDSGGVIFNAGTKKWAELVFGNEITIGARTVGFEDGDAYIGEYFFNRGQLCEIRTLIKDGATIEDFDKIINRL